MNNEWIGRTEMGDIKRIVGSTLRGFNVTRQQPPILPSKDHMGLVFFTRPQLNLSTVNIKHIRQFKQLLTKDETSIQRYVRCMLDPRLQFGIPSQLYNNERIETPLVDKFNPFIPVLSNLIQNMSGWPDMVVPNYTSSNGMRKEQFAMIDGTFEIFDYYELNCTFRNIINEPLTWLFQVWEQYAALVFEGMCHPYIDFISEFEIDYNTRIYRFITDESGRKIKKAACTGASFPRNVPMGKFFDFNHELNYSDQTKDINISFGCMGAIYNDIKIFFAFNRTWMIFNPMVKKWLTGDKIGSGLDVVDYELLPKLNYRCYPVIDMAKNEFVWLINKNDPVYKALIESVRKKYVNISGKSREFMNNTDNLNIKE